MGSPEKIRLILGNSRLDSLGRRGPPDRRPNLESIEFLVELGFGLGLPSPIIVQTMQVQGTRLTTQLVA